MSGHRGPLSSASGARGSEDSDGVREVRRKHRAQRGVVHAVAEEPRRRDGSAHREQLPRRLRVELPAPAAGVRASKSAGFWTVVLMMIGRLVYLPSASHE